MKQGALIFDKESGRYDIRFGLDDYNGGLNSTDKRGNEHGKITTTDT